VSSRDLSGLADRPYDGALLDRELKGFVGGLALDPDRRGTMRRASGSLLELLDGRAQPTLQARWQAVESELWPDWVAGRGRLEPVIQWSWGAAALVLSRAVRPGWVLLPRARLSQWLGWLPAGHPLPGRHACLCEAVAQVDWARHPDLKRRAALLGLRVMLARGYTQLEEIRSGDLETVPVACATGIDVLDSALCQLGVLSRTPQRGAQRRLRRGRLSPAELVERSRVPERFRDVHRLYLEAYSQRISDVYATTRHKHNSLEHLWVFLDERYPQVGSSAQVRREHLLAFIPHAIARAREVQRRQPRRGDEDRLTAHQWLVNVRCFFADICVWSTELASPFEGLAPPAVPARRFANCRASSNSRTTGSGKAGRPSCRALGLAVRPGEDAPEGVDHLAVVGHQDGRRLSCRRTRGARAGPIDHVRTVPRPAKGEIRRAAGCGVGAEEAVVDVEGHRPTPRGPVLPTRLGRWT